ncbi:MAG: tetratricopeptide repeat protein [Candidatus Solibacter sp.]
MRISGVRHAGLAIGWLMVCPLLRGQAPGLGTPTIAAHVKGPNQINLTWSAVPDPGYGYLIEVQSSADVRFREWTEMEPVRRASGYTCDPNVLMRNSRCGLSDPDGAMVYNPPDHGVPDWVTEAQYMDPQDDTPAQFIAWGLRPGTSYSFRVRTYLGGAKPVFGSYSNVAGSTTATYVARYVSPAGNDANDGKSADAAHAWRTLAKGSGTLACGQVLIVMGGSYPSDEVRMNQHCSADAKAVMLVNPGETATLTSQPANSGHAVFLTGEHLVVDGLTVASPGTPYGEYDADISGSRNALLNVEFHPPVIPAFKFGVALHGNHHLVYRSYLHDYGSPDAGQNPGGNGGFVLTLLDAADSAIWSNHLTRGGHDQSLCKSGCRYNRWLNNVMDGGWGQGWIGVEGAWDNLVEGNFIKGVGQIEPAYKPAIQVSGARNIVRRNVTAQTRSWALEVSAFGGATSESQIYNNVFYDSGGCYFQSSQGGTSAYNHVTFANNICYRVRDKAFQVYLGNQTNRNTNNTILSVNAAGKPLPDRPFVIWNQLGGGSFEADKSIPTVDRTYDPVFSRNRALLVLPRFVDEPNLDFHLATDSPLTDAGIAISNRRWGATEGAVDLGAYGLKIAPITASGDEAQTLAQQGNFPAAIEALRKRANVPYAQALEAALLRAGFEEPAAAALLAKSGPPAAGDLMGRFERVRQGTPDPVLWDLLAANPERLLELADLYIQWNLTRDAMQLLIHKYATPVAALHTAMMEYYRAYCRDRLDYSYYAGEALRLAGNLPVQGLVPRYAGAVRVFQVAVERNPADAGAQYLLAYAYQLAGKTPEAQDSLRNALKLRPNFPEAEALMAKSGTAPPPVRRIRPASREPAPDISNTATAAVPATPREIAFQALRTAAAGDAAAALGMFTAARFPQAQVEPAIREAYFEVRLKRIVDAAGAGKCPSAVQWLGQLEGADPALPFTAGGFAPLLRSVRVQYWVGVVEFACIDKEAARKRWEILAKATPVIGTTDYPFAILAVSKVNPAEGRTQIRQALIFLALQLKDDQPEHNGELLYSQGLLQLESGHKDEAATSFRAGVAAGPAGLVEYLNLDGARAVDAPK